MDDEIMVFVEDYYLAARALVDELADVPLVDGDARADASANAALYNINTSPDNDESSFWDGIVAWGQAQDEANGTSDWDGITGEALMAWAGAVLKQCAADFFDTAAEAFEAAGITPTEVPEDELVDVPMEVTVTQSDVPVAEGDAAVYTISLNQDASEDMTFTYEVTSDEADAVDFASATFGTVTIAAGESEATVTIDIAANDGAEYAEEFTVTITDSDGAEVAVLDNTIQDTSALDTVAPVVDADQAYTYDENQEADAVVATVTATDETGVTDFAITAGNDDGYFAINAAGEITMTEEGIAADLNDFEAGTDPVELTVTATDAAGNVSEEAVVTLTVGNVDDDPPALSTATIGGDSATLTFDEALDGESVPVPADFLVTVQGESTTIGVTSVTVSGNQVILDLGREAEDDEVFLVDYTPGDNPIQDAAGTAAEAIDDAELVEDSSAPVIEAGQSYSYQEETLAAGEAIGDAVVATDDVAVATFDITAGNDEGYFAIDNDGVLSLTDAGAAANVPSNDYESSPNSFDLEITATDSAGNTDVETVTVTVTDDAEDNGETFTLTTGTDAGSAFTGGDGDDTFFATEDTLTSNDELDGGAGDADLLDYASSSTAAAGLNEAGFVLKNIERVEVTGDATNGTTFDLTDTTGVETLINSNSAFDLTFTGAQELFDLEMEHVGGNVNNADTEVQYQASVVSGDTTQNVLLNDVMDNDGGAAGSLTIEGIETFNLTTDGQASHLTDLISTAMETVNVMGDQNLSIDEMLDGATTVDASTFEGNLSVELDSNGTARDVVVTGGSGDDTADFSAGFETGDEFDGGDGDGDTIVLTNALAIAAPAGSISNVEILDVSTGGTGTIDMDDFPGVGKVIYNAGLAGSSTVDDAVTGLEVEVDVNDGTAGQNLTVDLKTDGSSDELTFTLDRVLAGDTLGTVNGDDAETVTISVDDDTTDGTGTLAINSLSVQDATTLTLSGDAALTINAVSNPATPVLTTVSAADVTDTLTVTGMNFASSGATITLGSGGTTWNVGTAAGADSWTFGDGADTLVYSAAAQSSGTLSDTVYGFEQGEDVIDATLLGTVSTTLWRGNAANTTAAETALTGVAGQAIFVQSEGVLVVDNGDGTIGTGDLRINMDGITEMTAADLGLGLAGNTVTLSAAAANVSTTTNTNADRMTTNEDDTIISSIANLAGSTINGAFGTDTLQLSDAGAVGALAATVTNVEVLQLADGTNTGVAFNAAGAFTSVTGGTGSDTIADTANLAAGGTISMGAGTDTITALSADLAGTTIDMGAGNDIVTSTVGGVITATLTGGSDTDTLSLAAGDNISGAAVSGFEDLTLAGGAGVTMTIAQWDSLNDGTVTAAGAETITFTGAGTAATVAAVETYNAAVGGALTVDVGVAATTLYALTGNTGNDIFNLNAGWDATTDAINGGAGTDTVNITYDLGGAANLATGITLTENINVTASQTGALTIDDTINAGGGITFNASTVTAGLTVTNTVDGSNGALSITLGSGNDTVSLADDTGGNNTVINFGSGNDTLSAITSAAGGATITLNYGISAAGNIDSNTIATGANALTTGDTISFDGVDVAALAATLPASQLGGVANTVVVTNDGTDSTIIIDQNANGVVDAGQDVQITVTGQVLTTASFNLVGGDLVMA